MVRHKRTVSLLALLALSAMVTVSLAQDQGIQSIIGNVFLQDTTPGTEQIGHAAIKGTFRAGQVFVSQRTGTTTAIVGNNTATGVTSFGGSFSNAGTAGGALRGTATASSGSSVGVMGESRSSSGIGVHAKSTAFGAVALRATPAANGQAALFEGHVKSTGNLLLGEVSFGDKLNIDHGGMTLFAPPTGTGINIYNSNQLRRFSINPTGDKLAMNINRNGGFPWGSVYIGPGIVFNAGGQIIVYGEPSNTGSISTQADGRVAVTAAVKNFVEPNPDDLQTDIVYACVEGPEAAAYVRGTARLVNGAVRVEFPRHFQNVSVLEGMTVQLTPRSPDSLGLCVVERSLEGFTVRELQRGKGSYEFDWEAKAVRRGFEDYRVIRPMREQLGEVADQRGLMEARRRRTEGVPARPTRP